MTTSYTITITNSTQTIFNGTFFTTNNLITSFYDNTNPKVNILLPVNTFEENDNMLPIDFGGVSISSFPYFTQQGEPSSYFNLYFDGNQYFVGSSRIPVNVYIQKTHSPSFVTPLVFTNPSFPSGTTHRSGFFKSMYESAPLPTQLPNNKPFCMCYTYSKNFYYKPHTDSGMVGTSAAAYLARRKRM